MRFCRAAAVLAAMLISTSCILQPMAFDATEDGKLVGDVNVDGQIDIGDVILLSRYLAEIPTEFSAVARSNADCDHNGELTMEDCTRLLRWLARLVPDEEFFASMTETTTTTTETTTTTTETTASPYDLSGFAWQWPEVFAIDDTITITDHSYQSHDVSITITDYISAEQELAYFVADIYVRDLNCFRAAFAKGSYMEPGSAQLDSVKRMAADNNAILAINADYCEIRKSGIIYRNGILYRDVEKGDVATIHTNGVMDVKTKSEFSALTEEERSDIWHTLTFGPIMVRDGVAVTGYTSSIAVENPRSGLGYYEPGHYCFVMVDGRQEGYSMGLTLDEFALLFESLGCEQAYNLDGGRSAELVFHGETYDSPYKGGRSSSDILYICENPDK